MSPVLSTIQKGRWTWTGEAEKNVAFEEKPPGADYDNKEPFGQGLKLWKPHSPLLHEFSCTPWFTAAALPSILCLTVIWRGIADISAGLSQCCESIRVSIKLRKAAFAKKLPLAVGSLENIFLALCPLPPTIRICYRQLFPFFYHDPGAFGSRHTVFLVSYLSFSLWAISHPNGFSIAALLFQHVCDRYCLYAGSSDESGYKPTLRPGFC